MLAPMRILPVAAMLLPAALSAQQFEPPFRVMADGAPIAVDMGHAHPCLFDFDGDGVRDLLVGQFGDGKLRVYRNRGTASKPEFGAFAWFEGGGAVATTPSG